MPFAEKFRAQPRWLILSEMTALVLLIGFFDYATGWEWSLFSLYAVPIGVTVYYHHKWSGIAMALLSAWVWWAANRLANPYTTGWGYALATFTRLFYFCIVAFGVAAWKARDEAARAKIQALEHAHELEKEIIEISEREQQRIGQDLHDGLCQQLVASVYAVSSLKNDLQKSGSEKAEEAGQVEEFLRELVQQTRSLARGIFPVQMGAGGLATALDELCASMSRMLHVEVRFYPSGDLDGLDVQASIHLYRIAQEALSNAIRHGAAKRVEVRLARVNRRLELVVEDNGSGFLPERKNASGMGLRTMQYRAQFIGAQLNIQNSPKGGALVSCFMMTAPRNGVE